MRSSRPCRRQPPGMMWTVLLFAAQPDTSRDPDLPHSDTGLVEALCGVRIQPARHAAIARLKEEARAAHAVAYATARVPRKLGRGGIGAGAAPGRESPDMGQASPRHDVRFDVRRR